jgi:Ca2+:H+ antiporter
MVSRAEAEHRREAHDGELRESGGKEPQLSWFLTVVLLILVTAVSVYLQYTLNYVPSHRYIHSQAASVTAEILVRSMDEMNTVISKEWVALILLPAVTSLAGQICAWLFYYTLLTICAESMTAVNVSVKDRLSLSISIAVGGALVGFSISIRR